MNPDRNTRSDADAPPTRTAADVLASLARSDADIAAGRVVEIDIDALCDELEAEADAMEAAQRRPGAPSAE